MSTNRVFAICVLLFSFAGLSFAHAQPSDSVASESADLVQAVIQAMTSNRERLGAVSLTLSESRTPIRNDLASLPERIDTKLPDGGTFTTFPSKTTSITTSDILSSGAFFERRFYNANNELLNVWQSDEGLWNEYNLSKHSVIIRKSDQLPGMTPVDPNQLAALTMGESLEELLKSTSNLQGKRLEESEFGKDSIQLTLETTNGKQPLVLTFGSNHRFLPVRSTLYSPTGTALVDRTFEYQLAEPRDALLLKSVKAVIDVDPSISDPQHRQMVFIGEVVLSVDRYTLISEADIEQRKMAWDSSWLVHDMTNWKPGEIETEIGDAKSLYRLPLVLINLAIIVTIGVVLVIRRWLRS